MDTETPVAGNANPYAMLGVRPFINCCSVRTVHGGSLMLPQVSAAMAEASRHFVNLDELMEAAGARLAELTGAEWGLVTCGSAAAVSLATAACVAGNDPIKMLRLPFTEGWPRRVVMVRNQRFAYDQAIRMVGTEIYEIDSLDELEAAFSVPVAMVAILGTHEAQSAVRMEDFLPFTRPRGVPIMVDAASEHLENPSPWLVRGADLVIYSGGKFLRGPQTSGLLLGKKKLVQAAWRNASPHQAFGRPMKVSKEDVVGLRERLMEGSPRVMLDDMSATANSTVVNPFGLQPGEAAEVADAIVSALRAGAKAKLAAAVMTPGSAVAGNWVVHVDFLHGEREHRLHLVQDGNRLSGKQASLQFDGPVSGTISGDDVTLVFDTQYEGSTIRYHFSGTLADGAMAGKVLLGTSTAHHQGVVNLQQFGSADWSATPG